ncbi:hypothetical protein AB685_03810 [Bacillus sp. LL01]|nr:hypothetical protein AB685_03810 [Bacillus sp. LL01]
MKITLVRLMKESLVLIILTHDLGLDQDQGLDHTTLIFILTIFLFSHSPVLTPITQGMVTAEDMVVMDIK